MALENKIEMAADLLEAAKNFFIDLFRPDMTLEKISEVVSPRLDDTIRKYEGRGLQYSAGKFSIKYADEKHFQLDFEMYFQDSDGKWHKCANESEPRDATLLDVGAWKTIQALKVITFPIEKPKSVTDSVLKEDKKLEAYNTAERERILNEPLDTPLEKPVDKPVDKADDKSADENVDNPEKK